MLELTDICNGKMYASTMYMYIQCIEFHADFIYFKYILLEKYSYKQKVLETLSNEG